MRDTIYIKDCTNIINICETFCCLNLSSFSFFFLVFYTARCAYVLEGLKKQRNESSAVTKIPSVLQAGIAFCFFNFPVTLLTF